VSQIQLSPLIQTLIQKRESLLVIEDCSLPSLKKFLNQKVKLVAKNRRQIKKIKKALNQSLKLNQNINQYLQKTSSLNNRSSIDACCDKNKSVTSFNFTRLSMFFIKRLLKQSLKSNKNTLRYLKKSFSLNKTSYQAISSTYSHNAPSSTGRKDALTLPVLFGPVHATNHVTPLEKKTKIMNLKQDNEIINKKNNISVDNLSNNKLIKY